jgi:hypothetical protein
MHSDKKVLDEAFVCHGRVLSARALDALGIPAGRGSIFEWDESTPFLDYLIQTVGDTDVRDVGFDTPACEYDDEDFALLRHIYVEGATSARKFAAAFAGFYYFFRRTLPTVKDLMSRKCFKTRLLRLENCDHDGVREELSSLDDSEDLPCYSLSLISDCCHQDEERYVSYFGCPRPDGSGPCFVFTGIGPTTGKSNLHAARQAQDRMVKFVGSERCQRLIGSCHDLPAIGELQAFYALQEQAGVSMEVDPEYLIRMHDDMHKISLTNNACSNGAFGAPAGLNAQGSKSHFNLLCLRNYVVKQQPSLVKSWFEDFMGAPTKMPGAVNMNRWAFHLSFLVLSTFLPPPFVFSNLPSLFLCRWGTVGKASLQRCRERRACSTVHFDEEGDEGNFPTLAFTCFPLPIITPHTHIVLFVLPPPCLFILCRLPSLPLSLLQGLRHVPHAWERCAQESADLQQRLSKEIVLMQQDPRIITGVTFEAELYTKYTERCLNWSKAKSSIGQVLCLSPRSLHLSLPPTPTRFCFAQLTFANSRDL